MIRFAILAALAALASGCVKPNTVSCGDNICRAGEGCAPDGTTCAPTDALEHCAGATDGASCTTQDLPEGVCVAQICVPVGCGNGIVEPGELCDDGNRLSLDGCRSDCRSLERCGDGVSELTLDETCDCGDGTVPVLAGCNGPNSGAAGATCHANCTVPRCGDGVLDADELCDDGNTSYGDGCRGDCRGVFAKVPAGTTQGLSDVSIAGPDDVYVVGLERTLVHLHGGHADVVDTGLGTTGSSLVQHVFARGEVYIGGVSATLRRLGGGGWEPLSTGLGNPVSIVGTSANDVWVAGDGNASAVISLAHFTSPTDVGTLTATCNYGSTFNPKPRVQTLLSLPTGDVLIATDHGVCRHTTTAGWQPELTAEPIISIAGTSADDLWALDDLSQLWRFDAAGETWTLAPTTPGPFAALAALAAGRVMVVGYTGSIAIYDDAGWQVLASPTELGLTGIAATSPTDVWIVGASGTVLH